MGEIMHLFKFVHVISVTLSSSKYWLQEDQYSLKSVCKSVRSCIQNYNFCLGTGVPRHRDGVVRSYVRTYVRL